MDSRFEALHTRGLTPLVGREEESELLLRLWSRSKSGEGQLVLLSGEAGIGKSRLILIQEDVLVDVGAALNLALPEDQALIEVAIDELIRFGTGEHS
jgi:AAA ATPase domain